MLDVAVRTQCSLFPQTVPTITQVAAVIEDGGSLLKLYKIPQHPQVGGVANKIALYPVRLLCCSGFTGGLWRDYTTALAQASKERCLTAMP